MAASRTPRHVRRSASGGRAGRKKGAVSAGGRAGRKKGAVSAGDRAQRGDAAGAGSAPGRTLISGRARLQKILAAAGLGSRRTTEQYLRDGRVTVNGRTAQLGDSADPSVDVVGLDGERIGARAPSYWMLHKPTGVVTTLRDPERRATVADLLPPRAAGLFPVGRLDIDTSGLVLLTNDGALTQTLLHPSSGGEKEYVVVVKGEVLPAAVQRLEKGMQLDDGRTKPARVEGLSFEADRGLTTVRLVLTEGRKRQIRRSMLVLGHPVKTLRRVRVGPLRLGRLKRGEARPLRPGEVAALLAYVERLRRGEAPSLASPAAAPEAPRAIRARSQAKRGPAARDASRPRSGARPGKRPPDGPRAAKAARAEGKPGAGSSKAAGRGTTRPLASKRSPGELKPRSPSGPRSGSPRSGKPRPAGRPQARPSRKGSSR